MAEFQEITERFNGFDGALIQAITVNFGTTDEDSEVACQIKAFCEDHGTEHGWHHVLLRARRCAMFSWIESRSDTNLVLNCPVRAISWQGIRIIDFDPLHATLNRDGIKVFAWFIGGREISVESHLLPQSEQTQE